MLYNYAKLLIKVNAITFSTFSIIVTSLTATTGSAQSLPDVKVTIDIQNGSLRSVLSAIEKQTDFRFAYKNDMIGHLNNIDFSIHNESVKNALDALLPKYQMDYKQVSNNIIIFKKEPQKAQSALEDVTISGQVKDESGNPLPGVSVKVKGQNIITSTDVNGQFSIAAPGTQAVLVFSYIGYALREIRTDGRTTLSVSLQPEAGTLDALVVIGYGTTTKRYNTGSVSTVTAKEIASQPVSDPLSALQGRVAGLDVTGTSGYPGAAFQVRVRGNNSIFGGNDPLYIVDGIPYTSQTLDQVSGANGSTSPLNSINPSDIERIDVLKDADATAIYGSRGANGVILISTKKGQSGKLTVDTRVNTGVSFVSHKVDMLNTAQYLALRNQAFKNDELEPDEETAPDLKIWDQNLDQKWQDQLLGDAANLAEARLSVSGASAQTNFLLSGTYRRETTVLPTSTGFNRGAVNFNVNHHSLNDKFNLSTSVKFVGDENNSLPTDVTQYYNLAPNFPTYNPDGSYYWYRNEQNPLAFFERKYRSATQNLSGNSIVKYRILPGLSAQVSAGYNRITMKQTQTLPERSFNPDTYTSSMAYYGNTTVSSYNIEPQIDYTIAMYKSSLKLLAGVTWQSSIREGQRLDGDGYSNDEQLSNPNAAVTLVPKSFDYTNYKYNSFFGRATYNWDEKYIVNGTFRRDGSSRFGPGKKFGNFGAVGAAWLFTNESFIKENLRFLSFGKLRGSYGSVGNDQIGDYQYNDSWRPASFPYGGTGTLFPTRFANPNFQWEVNRKLETAIELGFLKDRILVTANYYRNKSGNMLVPYVLSPQSGFTDFIANLPAELENRGFEFELSTINVNNDHFRWNSALTLTIARNKLLKYPGLENTGYSTSYFIGQPINVVTGFQSTGINPETGLATFVDKDGDESIDDPNDLYILGTMTPKFYGGFSNTLAYKSWSLDFFFQFVKQEGPLLNYGYLSVPYGVVANKDLSALDSWTPEKPNTNIPIATTTTNEAYSTYSQWRLSTANWGDASFIRLKNVAVRYNLGRLFKGLKLSNCSVYLQGQNLFTITNYKGFDPETKGLVMPPLSTYTAGLQVSF